MRYKTNQDIGNEITAGMGLRWARSVLITPMSLTVIWAILKESL